MATNAEMYDKRRRLILEALTTPKTTYELAEELGVAQHTVRRTVLDLESEGLIQQTAWLEGRKKSYVTVVQSDDNSGVVMVTIPKSQPRPVGEFIGVTGDFVQLVPGENSGEWIYPPGSYVGWHRELSDIDGALAQAYLQSLYREDASADNAKAGVLTLAECRSILRSKLEWVDRLRIVIEQLVLAPIWDSPTKENARKFGQVNEMDASAIARQFEHRHGY